jgi:hypothetical protein
MSKKFRRKHGIGMIVARSIPHKSLDTRYYVKWLKSEEKMRFLKGDFMVISCSDWWKYP